tara:strand:- start:190 stop:561 length:372 start_codon:yes stop_codon:yes gene_type:complete
MAGVPAPRRSINRLTRGQTFDRRALSHVISLNARDTTKSSAASTPPSSRASSCEETSPASTDERSVESFESFDSVLDTAESAADASGSDARKQTGASRARPSAKTDALPGMNRTRRESDVSLT